MQYVHVSTSSGSFVFELNHYICTSTQTCSYCIVTDGPSPLNSSWDLVGAGCCQGFWGEEEGEGRSERGSFVGRLKEKGVVLEYQLQNRVENLADVSARCSGLLQGEEVFNPVLKLVFENYPFLMPEPAEKPSLQTERERKNQHMATAC